MTSTYFTHDELIPLLLANEAYALPPALLQQVMEGTLFLKKCQIGFTHIGPRTIFRGFPEKDELQFWMVLGEQAMESFERTDLQTLPQQQVSALPLPILAIGKASRLLG